LIRSNDADAHANAIMVKEGWPDPVSPQSKLGEFDLFVAADTLGAAARGEYC
jgi:hypothetical protein